MGGGGETLSHFDIRDDNLLIRPDGTAAILDWGMARLGPAWVDPLLLALQNSTDSAVCQVDSLDPAEQEAAVDFLTAFAGSQAWNAQQPARPGLPHLAAFCAEDATRLFAAAEALSGRTDAGLSTEDSARRAGPGRTRHGQ